MSWRLQTALQVRDVNAVINELNFNWAYDREFNPHLGLMTLMRKELTNVLRKVTGFLRVLRFLPTGNDRNVDKVVVIVKFRATERAGPGEQLTPSPQPTRSPQFEK